MAKLVKLPSLDIIHGFNGVLDFYYWKGIPVVRKWPYNPKSHHTDATIAAAEKFGLATKGYSKLAADQINAFKAEALDHTRTARDIYMTAAYGHLHRLIMAEFEDMLQSCADSLDNLEALLNALASVDTDRIIVDVASSVLPSGAATESTLATLATEAKLELARALLASIDGTDFATQTTLVALLAELELKADLTETQPISVASLPLPTGAATTAKQDTMIASLQLIDDLQGALVSVGADTLKVTGEDQMFSFGDQWMEHTEDLAATAGENLLTLSETPAGTIRILTSVCALNTTSACTAIRIYTSDGSVSYNLKWKLVSAAYEAVSWHGWLPLLEGDTVKATYDGCTDGDNIYLDAHGFGMGQAGYTPGEWDPSGASYQDKSCNVSTKDATPSDIFFKPDGTRFYILGNTTGYAYSYALSTAWDLSTCSFLRQSAHLEPVHRDMTGFFFKPDGTKLYYIITNHGRVYPLSLSTPWDISTASFDPLTYPVGDQDDYPEDVFFKPDGTKFYIMGDEHNTVYQYTTGGDWEVDGSTYDGKSADISTQDTSPTGLWFNPDGDKMFVIGTQNNSVYLYDLTTPWDVSTASYSGKSFDVSTQDDNPQGLFFTDDGLKLYISGDQHNTVYQYTLEQP